MNLTLKHTAALLLFIIGLISLNVYQWKNPQVVEAPEGTIAIDSTAWVQRSAYTTRGAIIDSLEAQNSALAAKVKEYGNQIHSYANITGRLRVEKDSLENKLEEWHDIPNQQSDSSYLQKARYNALQYKTLIDTTFITQRQFGGGLFLVTGTVEFKGGQFRQQLNLEQLRDIRLDVATTVSKDQSRVLTFVTSPDFEQLEYKSFTSLKPERKRLPWFWIGLATGVAGAVLIIE